jgi:hypothetical protein
VAHSSWTAGVDLSFSFERYEMLGGTYVQGLSPSGCCCTHRRWTRPAPHPSAAGPVQHQEGDRETHGEPTEHCIHAGFNRGGGGGGGGEGGTLVMGVGEGGSSGCACQPFLWSLLRETIQHHIGD